MFFVMFSFIYYYKLANRCIVLITYHKTILLRGVKIFRELFVKNEDKNEDKMI